MSDHIVDGNKMPADGYYNALVQCDTGGEMFQAVEVCEGKVIRSNGVELNASACSDFIPLAAWNFCSAFPVIAGAELDTLRTANAALVEQIDKYQREFRIAILRAELAEDRVKRLESVLTAGVALMRATDPFTLPPDAENDEGVTIRQLEPDAHIGWDEPPTACEHVALYDAVLAFGRAVAEAKATP